MLSFLFKLIKFVFLSFVVIFGLIMAIGLLGVFFSDDNWEEEPLPKDEYSEYIPVEDDNSGQDTLLNGYMKHYRVWRDFDQNVFEGEYYVYDRDLKSSYLHRTRIADEQTTRNPAYNNYYLRNSELREKDSNLFYWTWIYETVLDHDKPLMSGMIAMFDSIQNAAQPDRLHFAEIIVSHVQYIPYSLIHALTCEEYISDDPYCEGFRCKYHRDGNPCVASIAHGIFAPVEFAYNLKGDCDTRVLLLMEILDHYGYDVKMLYSYEYGHAVLGINLPTTGYYVTLAGIRYYLWETTNTGWLPGQIEPQYQNMNYWVAMDTRF
ncbi:MAG: hypothetical protein R3C61_18240 [Bacteroidia bacterium]